MVMGIMLAHGGGISLASEPNKGTVVTLLIPGN
jgi:signal transduction histidine kinase